MFTVPRYLQKFASHVLVGVLNSEPAQARAPTIWQCALRALMSVGAGTASTIAAQDVLYGALHATIFRPILNKLGFDKLELVVSGGAGCRPRRMPRSGICTASMSSRCTARPEEAGGIIAGQRGPFRVPAMSARRLKDWK